MPTVQSKFEQFVLNYIPPSVLQLIIQSSTAQKYGAFWSLAAFIFSLKYLYYRKQKRLEEELRRKSGRKFSTSHSIHVNGEFLRQMKFLLKIMFPSIWCKETGILLSHTSILAAKTFLSLYVAQLEGTIVKEIVQRLEESI